MIDVYVTGLSIDMGRQGENLARNIYFDLSELVSTYGEGTATLVYVRPSERAPYVCTTVRTGTFLIWSPTSTDTAYSGTGKCELRWVVGETLAKSIVYNTSIAPSIMSANQVPDPYLSWYDAIIAYIEANYAANGAPQEVREAIYTLLSKAAYTETGLTDELAIVQAWTAETISVTNNLTHVTNSNSATMAEQGGSYTGTLTADSGYVLGTVTVTMGGEDVTATVYSSGTITIPSVTGDIVITATAVAAVSSLSAVYTQSGTVYETDALDTLKADLVVTATYSDSTTATVPSGDYTLSGTLEAGTSTVTVSYGGKTATFNVTVSTAPILPAEYQQVEYIQTTGTQHIVTDFVLQNSLTGLPHTTFNVDAVCDSWQSSYGTNILACFGSGGGAWIGYNNTKAQIAMGTSTGMYYNDDAFVRHSYAYSCTDSTGKFTRDDGEIITRSITGVNNVPFELFYYVTTSGTQNNFHFAGKLYSCDVSYDGVKVLDLYPCYRKSDGEIGLYDIVNDRFYTNDGTGTFGKGSDV